MGLRFNYVSLYSTLKDTTFFNFPYDDITLRNAALNGSVGLVYKPTKNWQFNMNLSSGFRAPNIDDVAKITQTQGEFDVLLGKQNGKTDFLELSDSFIENIHHGRGQPFGGFIQQ